MVDDAKTMLVPALKSWTAHSGEIILGIRCNGGKQRSVGMSRLIKFFLEARHTEVHASYLNRERFCGCHQCNGYVDPEFQMSVRAFEQCWGATSSSAAGAASSS